MIVYGKQVFFYILRKHKARIKRLFLAKECDKESFKEIAKSGLKVQKLDFKAAQGLARGGNHQGFLLEIDDYEFCALNELKKSEFVVLLCGLSDVGNIGQIARTAYALGVNGMIFIGQNLAMEGVIRSSSGAAMDLKIALHNDAFGILNEFKQSGFKLFASAAQGEKADKIDGKSLLILGSEGAGLPLKILKKCDQILGIKMQNNFDSLNVSSAFAILCDRMING